jgi:hypothetical protein
VNFFSCKSFVLSTTPTKQRNYVKKKFFCLCFDNKIQMGGLRLNKLQLFLFSSSVSFFFSLFLINLPIFIHPHNQHNYLFQLFFPSFSPPLLDHKSIRPSTRSSTSSKQRKRSQKSSFFERLQFL